MAFENGVVVFFREMDKRSNNLVRSVLPAGRQVEIRNHLGHPEDYVVTDENDELLGVFPRDWVACILPLIMESNEDANDQQARRGGSPAPASGNSQKLS